MKKWIIGVLVLLFAVYMVAQPRNNQNKLPLATKVQSNLTKAMEYNYAAVTANNDGTVMPLVF